MSPTSASVTSSNQARPVAVPLRPRCEPHPVRGRGGDERRLDARPVPRAADGRGVVRERERGHRERRGAPRWGSARAGRRRPRGSSPRRRGGRRGRPGGPPSPTARSSDAGASAPSSIAAAPPWPPSARRTTAPAGAGPSSDQPEGRAAAPAVSKPAFGTATGVSVAAASASGAVAASRAATSRVRGESEQAHRRILPCHSEGLRLRRVPQESAVPADSSTPGSAEAPRNDTCYPHPLAMISFTRVSKQYGRQVLFVDASFQLNPGEKVGLVGPNGAGKTTLFRMIVGEEAPDEGEVSVPKKLTIGYFRQDVEEMSGRSVLDEAIAGQRPPRRPAPRARGPAARDGRPRARRRDGPHPRALRRGAGGVRAPRRLRARGAGARGAARPRLRRRARSTATSAPSPAAGRCAWRWRACCSAGPTCC